MLLVKPVAALANEGAVNEGKEAIDAKSNGKRGIGLFLVEEDLISVVAPDVEWAPVIILDADGSIAAHIRGLNERFQHYKRGSRPPFVPTSDKVEVVVILPF